MSNNKGFSAIVLVLIIGVSSLIMATGATFLSLRELDMGTNSSMGKRALYAAESCIDDALMRFRDDNAYSATEKRIDINKCECIYSTSSSGSERTISSNGICDEFNIGLEINIDITNGISINTRDFK